MSIVRSKISPADGAAIRTCRVLGILLMMSVHVYPGPSTPSFVSGGPFDWFGEIWIDFFGRASVVTLSVISGFLLVPTLRSKNTETILRSRAGVLIAPMVFWNCLSLLVMIVVAAYYVDLQHKISGLMSPLALINSIFGVSGPTVNMSLFFLRDLFISVVLVTLTWRVIEHYLPLVLVLVLVASVFDALEPVVFRPTILLFMLFGCFLHSRGLSLRRLDSLLALTTFALAYVAFKLLRDHFGWESAAVGEVSEILMRCLLILAMVWVAFRIQKTWFQTHIVDRLEPFVFLAYLSHVLISQISWRIFSMTGVIEVAEPSYLLYFFAVPAMAFGFSIAATSVIERLPVPLQYVIKGKTSATQSMVSPTKNLRGVAETKAG